MNVSIFLSTIYVLGWGVIPTFDKLALRTADQYALIWSVFLLSFIFMSTYVFIFTSDPKTTTGTALYTGYTWMSAGSTTIVYLCYFVLLNKKNVIYVVMLQPLLLSVQAVCSMIVLGERMSVWNWCGMGISLFGMLVYNGAELVAQTFPKFL